MSQSIFETTAQRYEELAAELELAAQHLRVTATHFRNKEIARASAHAWAAHGHIRTAQTGMDELAIQHAAKAIPEA